MDELTSEFVRRKLAVMRRRGRIGWIAIIASGPAALVLVLVAERLGVTNLDPVFFGTALLVAGIGGVYSCLNSFSRCPRCSKPFFGFFPFAPLWRCANCDLSLYSRWEGGPMERAMIRDWLRNRGSGKPIPVVGLRCPKCDYSLAGLVEELCPECGSSFDIAQITGEKVD